MAEGGAVPVEGWDFSWFDGRATEERPPWGYARLHGGAHGRRRGRAGRQTGGGEVLATVARPPALLVATESWPPNVARGPRPPAPAGCPRGRGGRRADAALRRRLVRPRGEPPPRRRAVGGDRPGPAAGRDVPVPTDRRRLQPGAHRLHHGAAAGQRRPQPGAGPRGGSGGRARGGRAARPARSASSSSTSPPWCTSCARCPGRCRASRPRATATGCAACTS